MKARNIFLIILALIFSGVALLWHRFMLQHETIKNICSTAVGMNMEALHAVASREKLKISGPANQKMMHGAASYGRSVCILRHAPDGTVQEAQFQSSILE